MDPEDEHGIMMESSEHLGAGEADRSDALGAGEEDLSSAEGDVLRL